MKNIENKIIHLIYFAVLRDRRGADSETIETVSTTPQELYKELQSLYQFSFPEDSLKVSINDQISAWTSRLKTEDTVVFIPPVSGG